MDVSYRIPVAMSRYGGRVRWCRCAALPDDDEADDEKADIEDKEVAAAAEVTEADEVLEPF